MGLAKKEYYSIEEWELGLEIEKSYYMQGEILSMAPTGWDHGEVQNKLAEFLSSFRLKKKNSNDSMPPDEKWKFISEASVKYLNSQYGFVHDLAGWKINRWTNPLAKSAITTPPDWVCEILSPTNSTKDFIDVKQVLLKALVPNYWIIDILQKRIILYSYQDEYKMAQSFTLNESTQKNPPIIAPFNQPIDLEELFF